MVRSPTSLVGQAQEPAGVITRAGVGQGIRRMLPVAVFVVPFGIAFGVAAAEQGLTPAQSITMSALVFAGASQFAALDLWQAPLPYVSLALVVLAVNARHLILGAALSGRVNALPRGQRVLALMLLSDANFADSHAAFKAGANDVGILLGGGFALWTAWVLGTTVGALAGSVVGSLEQFGVDVVMPAFFVAVLADELGTGRHVLPVVIAGVIATATLSLLPTGWNIIAAALCGGAVGAWRSAG